MQAIIASGTPEEIAALVAAIQERRKGSGEAPAEIIRKVVRSTIDDTQTDTASQ